MFNGILAQSMTSPQLNPSPLFSPPKNETKPTKIFLRRQNSKNDRFIEVQDYKILSGFPFGHTLELQEVQTQSNG
jgi:hypothetical protein